MKTITAAAVALAALASTPALTQATTPAEDLKIYREYFMNNFPGVPLNEFGNGVYAIHKVSRDSWEAIEEFPPYEPMIDEGRAMWGTPFANGKSYMDCFKGGPAQRKSYPHWDKTRGMVVTLPLAINECRTSNGEEPLKYKKGKIASLLAYMSYESRGQTIDVKVPSDDPKALAAYNKGKQLYFARRGQLNFSCAHCHMASAALSIRADILSPALGHASGWPVYRSKWGELGTLHRRFVGCNKQVRAKPFEAQGEEYRDLEYFLTHMSNGIEYNGPSSRK